jgi:DNA-binding PadR family transcriptional regulator
MEEAGLLVSHGEIVEGRVRRVYEATDAGKRELAELRVAVSELADEVLTDRRRLPKRRPPGRSTLPRADR